MKNYYKNETLLVDLKVEGILSVYENIEKIKINMSHAAFVICVVDNFKDTDSEKYPLRLFVYDSIFIKIL
jgi:hypothetical protein